MAGVKLPKMHDLEEASFIAHGHGAKIMQCIAGPWIAQCGSAFAAAVQPEPHDCSCIPCFYLATGAAQVVQLKRILHLDQSSRARTQVTRQAISSWVANLKAGNKHDASSVPC